MSLDSVPAAALPDCTHRPPCPGCPRFGEPGPAPAARARLTALARELGAAEPRFIEGARSGYRHRARLVVRGRPRSPKVGLFQANSHRIVDVPRCPIHHPHINRIASEVKLAMRELAIHPYADAPHRGCVRSLQLAVQRGSGDAVQLVVVENAEAPGEAARLLDRLAGRLGARLQGLFWNGNPERTNTILGPHWRHWAGAERIEERIGPGRAAVFFPPDAFGQSNLPLFDAVARRVDEWVGPARRVAEFYAGSGALGLNLAARGCEVWFNEVSPGGLRGLAAGIDALDQAARLRVRLCDGPAERVAPQLLGDEAFDAALVDPPRRGLDPAVMAALCQSGPARLVALSCGLDAFEREARTLVRDGSYALCAIEGYDLFPHTEHIETLALFERRA